MLREDGHPWGWMDGKEDKLQTGTLIRSLMHRVNKQQRQEELEVSVRMERSIWMQKNQHIVNSIYEKYGIKPYLILLYLVHLLNLLRRLNPHISCYVSWTSCVLSDFLKGKECLLSLCSIILLSHLSTLVNFIPISSESTDCGYTILRLKFGQTKELISICCNNLAIHY